MTMQHEQLTVGLFDWIDFDPSVSLADRYEMRFKMLKYADQHGYYAFHSAEHDASPTGGVPSPSVFLSAAAQHTKNIRLTPLVYILPTYHPLKLAQEICMVDHLSRGRLDIAFGRGASEHELSSVGVNMKDTRQMYDEGFEVVLQALRDGEVTHRGKYYNFEKFPFPMRPYQKPYPSMWYPSQNMATIPWMASNAINTVMLSTIRPEIRVLTAEYRRVFNENKGKQGKLNPNVTSPKLGVARHIYVADTDAQAQREGRQAFEGYVAHHVYKRTPEAILRVPSLNNVDAGFKEELVIVGSPKTVREKLQQQIDETTCNYVAGVFAFGNMTEQQALHSLELFTTHVKPMLKMAGPAQ